MSRSQSSLPSTVYRLPSLTSVCATLLLTAVVLLPAQTLTPIAPARSVTALSDSLKADSLAAAKPKSRVDTTLVVMHHFNHRQQLITGGAIMATMISIMVVMNNYNPRVPQ